MSFENFFLQALVILLSVQFFFVTNMYYNLLFFSFFLITLSWLLSILNFELFAIFMLLSELAVVFSLMLVFFHFFFSFFKYFNKLINLHNIFFCSIIIFLVNLIFFQKNLKSSFDVVFFCAEWFDFFSVLNYDTNSDFFALFIGLYKFMGLFTLIVYTLLLQASIIALTLLLYCTLNTKILMTTSLSAQNSQLNNSTVFFLRKQQLAWQNLKTVNVSFYGSKKL